MSKVVKNRFLLFFSAVLAILCSLAVFTARAETRTFTMEDGRVSESLNLVTAEPARAGDNIREASNYGIVFEDGAFWAAATGDWFRAAMRLENRYLDAETVIMNGEEVPADHATAYISVDLTFTSAAENRNFGTLIGTSKNGNTTTYYAAVVSFSQKIVFLYTFDVDEAGNYIAGTETQGPASYTPVEIELGTKYGLEVLLSPSLGITVCWNGMTVCENLQTVYETGKSLLSLTPAVGLSWADVTGQAENFVLKYLDADAAVSEEAPVIESIALEKIYFIDYVPSRIEDVLGSCYNLSRIIWQKTGIIGRTEDMFLIFPPDTIGRKIVNQYVKNEIYFEYRYCDYIFPASISYYLNYEIENHDGYHWIDDYDYGSKITYIPEAPTREGYIFDGWYKEDCYETKS